MLYPLKEEAPLNGDSTVEKPREQQRVGTDKELDHPVSHQRVDSQPRAETPGRETTESQPSHESREDRRQSPGAGPEDRVQPPAPDHLVAEAGDAGEKGRRRRGGFVGRRKRAVTGYSFCGPGARIR